MLPALSSLEEKYRLLTLALSDPTLSANSQRYREVSKERSDLEPLIRRLEEHRKALSGRAGS
jgi:protein subunit release factor A